jgi:hypothetical protein
MEIANWYKKFLATAQPVAAQQTCRFAPHAYVISRRRATDTPHQRRNQRATPRALREQPVGH